MLYLTPAWPNFAAAAGVAGAQCRWRSRSIISGNGWSCDIDRIEAAITPRTRAIFVNTPSNPTGWTADRETLQAILDLARAQGPLDHRRRDLRAVPLSAASARASFLDIMEAEDRILFVNTFSKNWAMTGWRVGWLQDASVACAQCSRT